MNKIENIADSLSFALAIIEEKEARGEAVIECEPGAVILGAARKTGEGGETGVDRFEIHASVVEKGGFLSVETSDKRVVFVVNTKTGNLSVDMICGDHDSLKRRTSRNKGINFLDEFFGGLSNNYWIFRRGVRSGAIDKDNYTRYENSNCESKKNPETIINLYRIVLLGFFGLFTLIRERAIFVHVHLSIKLFV